MTVDQSPMNQLITEHIDIWTSAVKTKSTSGRGSSKKLELYGVKKLRELILELAVRGKLVPQDPNDEPAAVLLERIALEKAQLVKEKKIKKPKSLAPIEQNDISYRLPNGWAVARLGSICNKLTDGSHNPAKDAGLGYPMYSSQNVQFREIDFSNPSRYVDELNYQKEHARTQVQSGDILLTIVGTLGRAAVVPDNAPDFVLQRSVAVIESALSSDFLTYFFSAPVCINYFEEHGKGTAQKGIYLGKLSLMPVFVPPVEEQHRIVTKVDELMALCDQLEQQTEVSIEAHQVLVTTLLDTLTNSADANELMQNWARISEHFDTLFTTEESIDQLKQTILQLAVMGKLVPQDPSDEPAAELLKRIAEEKAQLVKEKKIKKHPNVEPIGDVGIIPKTWKAIVVQDFADIRLGSTPSRHESSYWNGNIPWVSSGEVANGVIVDTAEKITQSGFDNSSTSIIPKGSLLMAIIGQGKTRGQTALLDIDACTNQNVAAFVFNRQFIIPEYVWLWAQSKYESHRQGGHGGAQPALNGKKVRSFAFPLPPAEEQKRIVEKVKKLNSLCEQLKTRLKDSQVTQLHLTDAIVEQAV